jgi:hypothetical protein
MDEFMVRAILLWLQRKPAHASEIRKSFKCPIESFRDRRILSA